MGCNYLDLFSGIGGFHKGLEEAGLKFGWTGHSEIDRHAKSIYQKHFPQSEDLGDVSNINVSDLPKVDLVTFGFPCQDLSIAGKREGLGASRSGLFHEAIRIIGAKRPSYFIFENVKGLFSSNGGKDFLSILGASADIGYDGQWQLLNSRGFGIPHNRERVFFVGYPRGTCKRQIFPIEEKVRRENQEQVSQRYRNDIKPLWRVSLPESARRAILRGRRLRKFTEKEYARIQGFPDNWFEGFSWVNAHKGAGNAVSVPVVKVVGEKMYGV